MSKKLFSNFNEVSTKQWKQKIQVDLKGADYNDTLIWKTPEGINVKPFYNSDDLISVPEINASLSNPWKICQTIFVSDVAKSNLKALDVIKRGAESITFIIPNEDVDVEALLKNIDPASAPIYIEPQFLSEAFVKGLESLPERDNIYVHVDIIGNLARTGNWYFNLKEDHTLFKAIVKQTSTITIDTALYQNAGATIVQQMAYGLSHANEYLDHLINTKTASSKSKKPSFNVAFKTSIGTNYFFEIAKLRALRLLWETLADDYGISSRCLIIAQPTKRNKTIYDYNTNLLRTTTECMSAFVGGANMVCNLPYDAIYHKDNEFGERIARNQLLILKHESYFDKVLNPADGAYYIESLTQQLAENALALFKDIEAHGGFLKQLKSGTVQRKIKESASLEQDQFNTGDLILLGTNKHPNPKDKMAHQLELYPFVKTNKRKTLIEPIIERRLAEHNEQVRLKTE